MHFAGTLGPEQFWEQIRAMEGQVRESLSGRACYGLVGWLGSRAIAEWALGDSTFSSVEYAGVDEGTGAAAQVLVATSSDEGEDALQHVLMNLPSAEPAEDRLARMLANRAIPASDGRVTLTVSGRSAPFDVRLVGSFAVADAMVDAHRIVIRAQGVELETVALERIDDIEPYLAGRRELIRKARAEYGITDRD